MSGNTSATGGPLTPTTTAPPSGPALADVLQALVAGACGLPGPMVRPRWQAIPPPQPDAADDWCAVGVTRISTMDHVFLAHDGTGLGSSTLQRHEQVEALASFYGPDCQGFATVCRDGLTIAQNFEGTGGLVFVEAGELVAVPDLVNLQWVNRCDLPMTFRRSVARTYPIRNVLTASGAIDPDPLAGFPWSAAP